MTQSEFIKKYCEEGELTEKELNDEGIVCIPCMCDDAECEGWAMVSKNK